MRLRRGTVLGAVRTTSFIPYMKWVEFYPHFTDEETATQADLSKLPEVSHPVTGGVGPWAWADARSSDHGTHRRPLGAAPSHLWQQREPFRAVPGSEEAVSLTEAHYSRCRGGIPLPSPYARQLGDQPKA